MCRTEFALELEAHNPELLDMAVRCARDVGAPVEFPQIMSGFSFFYRLIMAHNSAEGQRTYVEVMQCFALLYASLIEQPVAERGALQ